MNDVHIRYEDSDADPSHPFAVGIMLERMSAQSTDGTWVGIMLERMSAQSTDGTWVGISTLKCSGGHTNHSLYLQWYWKTVYMYVCMVLVYATFG